MKDHPQHIAKINLDQIPQGALLLEMTGIWKTYEDNQIQANQDVHFDLRKGEIHALVGENGAGKTTLMKILCGLERADKGSIHIAGQPVRIHSTHDADELGIGMVHQRFCLVDGFSVADNIVLGKEPRRASFFYDHIGAKRAVADLAARYGFEIDPGVSVSSLTVGQKQRVEILKILYRGSRILVLDEPTSLLTEQEVKGFFDTLRNLRKMGYTIVIITHKLEEVGSISDRVTVMREGKVVASLPTIETTKTELARMMVGKEVVLQVEKLEQRPGKPILTISHLTMVLHGRPRPFLFDVNLQVRQGEILGIAGVAGNGLGELEDVLGGMKQQGTVSGEIHLEGRNILGLSPARLRSAGFAYVPADRLQRGSSLLLSVSDNLIVADHHSFLSHGVLQKNKISDFACELIDKFSIKGTARMPIGTLSGGNIQKTVLSREFSRRPKFLLISEPTWGLDVACSEFVYNQILFMRAQGTAILLISSNLDEVLALSDTIVVLYQGQVVGKFVNRNLDREFLGGYMLGLKRDESGSEPSQIMAVA